MANNKITLDHLVYQVLGFATSGSLTNDVTISYEQAEQWILEQRAILISQSITKGDDINDSFLQYLCAEMELVDASQCPCEAPIDCLILRSKQQLPSTIDYYKDNSINSITTPSGEAISKSNPVMQRYQKYNKYISNSRTWFIKDDYLYILNDSFLEYVSVSGLFENPRELARFTCSGVACFTGDSEFPITMNLASTIIDIIVKTKIAPYMMMPSDISNNANAQTPQQIEQGKQAGK